jgi:hypothetical protein
MKYLIVAAILYAGYYLYTSHKDAAIVVDSYSTLLQKIDVSTVTLNEAKQGAQALAVSFCNDSGLQSTRQKTTGQCMERLDHYRDMCLDRVFKDAPPDTSSKPLVTTLAKSYAACVGAI